MSAHAATDRRTEHDNVPPTRHFHRDMPPRAVEVVDADVRALEDQTQLREISA